MTARLSPQREAEIREHLASTDNFSLGNLAARDLLAELAAVRKERDEARETVDFLERNTLPELRRTAEYHQDGKKRWRVRAEKAEPERDAFQERLHQAALAKVWRNEDGKKFVFVEDIAPALLGIKPGTEADR